MRPGFAKTQDVNNRPAPPIVMVGQNSWRTARAAASGVLVDAADYYRVFTREAQHAERSILMSGWQFDSGVPLLRGDDVQPGGPADVRLLKFLNQLCEAKKELNIYILAWDFHMIFALEREWMQKLLFQWKSNERIHFRFDECEAQQGSHHQKFVVIDRAIAFVGGIDICESRWDDRRHLSENPLRLSHNRPSKPYHDVQSYLVGCDTADVLRELFADRWARSQGAPLALPACEGPAAALDPPGGLPLGEATVAFSRTDPRGQGEAVREVERLFLDAVGAAERLIYIETQYFSSRAVCGALMKQMRARRGHGLQIVVILNEKAEAVKEEIAVGLAQAKNLKRLRRAAAATGTALGIYYTRSDGTDDDRPATYIHTKLMSVDDRFLTVGSANLTNRSMGVDSELHVSWESTSPAADDPAGERLRRAIRRVRVSLLAEHTGTRGAAVRGLLRPNGLVAALDARARDGRRLCLHGSPTPQEDDVLAIINPQALPFDPDTPTFDRDEDEDDGDEDNGSDGAADPHAAGNGTAHAEEAAQSRPLFVGGLGALWERLKP
jgi:phospholipase D1/2